MTNSELLLATFQNITAQWNEDALKKPSITDLQRYNQMVVIANKMEAGGLFNPALLPSAVGDFWATEFDTAGYTAINVMLTDTYAADWGATWPVALGT